MIGCSHGLSNANAANRVFLDSSYTATIHIVQYTTHYIRSIMYGFLVWGTKTHD